MKTLICFLVLTMALGCGSTDSGNTGGTGGTGGQAGAGGTGGQNFSPDPPLIIGGDERPAEVDIPTDYDPTASHPLVIVLHGFGTDGVTETGYLQLFDFVDEKQFVLIFPDGTLNDNDDRFWNATQACCDPGNTVDDVGYLSGLIEEAKATYNIDPKRVYLIGHSNGGFMSFRMACEASELITAIVSLAGSTFDDPADCQPATTPVSVLAVHGTADATIPYEGRTSEPDREIFGFPGAVETVERFASAGGCDTNSPTDEGSVDLIPSLEGAETDKVAYSTGCDEGIDAGLWTLNEGGHIPFFSTAFADMTTDWLFRHSR
jgi:polyhydroxybutyrate depolymerase